MLYCMNPSDGWDTLPRELLSLFRLSGNTKKASSTASTTLVGTASYVVEGIESRDVFFANTVTLAAISGKDNVSWLVRRQVGESQSPR
jgi:hypothetical protein